MVTWSGSKIVVFSPQILAASPLLHTHTHTHFCGACAPCPCLHTLELACAHSPCLSSLSLCHTAPLFPLSRARSLPCLLPPSPCATLPPFSAFACAHSPCLSALPMRAPCASCQCRPPWRSKSTRQLPPRVQWPWRRHPWTLGCSHLYRLPLHSYPQTSLPYA
jgi:hypothetical protein